MKILVVSLLRLGDLIQQIPLIEGIQYQYPDAEIDILINKQFSHAQSLLAGRVSRVIHFDREALQKGLGEANYNIMWSHGKLKTLLADLSASNYDQVYNFTHTKLSAFLIGGIVAKKKIGLSHAQGRFQGLENPWLRYFNDQFSGQGPSLFHYVEILGKAFDLPVQKPNSLAAMPRKKRILLQCLTSDSKKNWGLDKFLGLKNEIENSLVDFKVQILGAPFERETLLEVFSEKDLLIADLAEVRALLKEFDLLVTGDTSIKHLAAQVGLPIVEIVLGASDLSKTGAFQKDSVAITAKLPCAPCVHSKPCSQSSHLCADTITVGRVFEAVWEMLSREASAVIADRDFDRMVFEKHFDRGETRTRLNLTAKLSAETIAQTVELHKMAARIERALPAPKRLTAATSLTAEMGELILCAQDILKSGQDEAGYFRSFIESLIQKYTNPLQIHTRVTKALAEVRELLRIRDELTMQLGQKISMEGEYYAKGIGQLSISGFEETREGLQRDYEDADL